MKLKVDKIIRLFFFKIYNEKAIHDAPVTKIKQILQTKLAESKNDGGGNFRMKKCDMVEKAIDAVVYNLYELTTVEKDLIESY